MSETGERPRAKSYFVLVVSVAAATLLLVAIAMILLDDPAGNVETLFIDVYESTGSRLAGFISLVGVVAFAVTAGISVFAGKVTWTQPSASQNSRWLFWAGLLTGMLALDDYLAIHELADDVLAIVTGVEAERALKNVLEAGVLGVYALLFAVLLWRYRSTVANSEWPLLAISVSLLLASLAFDLGPHTWLAETFGVSLQSQDMIEDTLKLMGIALYGTYFVRLSSTTVRTSARYVAG